jgi:beta-mannosidase
LGESFYFKVNGIPVYAKGANYIPQNSFQNRVTRSDYEQLLQDVVDANMNMLRVWGGGIYENDEFYQLCDEKGIMLWQDFMFACAMYPGDKDFLSNVKQEAIDNMARLRNHPSIVLWCGNNENSEGWYRWGWQEGRSESEKEEIWASYLKLFDSLLPEMVDAFTDVPYWESSPKYGRGNPKYQFEGDAHDWWVWHDGYPFEHFETEVPRFMSEFGFQSFPSAEIIQLINESDSLDLTTEAVQNHQKHSRGFELIREYMARDFPLVEDPEHYIYMSQLVQAYGITKGIEAHRRARPYNMGSLYWQLNDCWPAISWSSIDFKGRWKALHYKAKHSFENVLISPQINGDKKLEVWLVNDGLKNHTGMLELKVLNFMGESLWAMSRPIRVYPNSSSMPLLVDLEEIASARDSVVLQVSFNEYSRLFYFEQPKDIRLIKGEISTEIMKSTGGFDIELSSPVLQKDVFLSTALEGRFSDNFFDLLPNRPKIVHFQTEEENIPELQMISFNNFIREVER